MNSTQTKTSPERIFFYKTMDRFSTTGGGFATGRDLGDFLEIRDMYQREGKT